MEQIPKDPGIFVKCPVAAGLISLFLELFFGYVLIMLIFDVNTVPSDPQRLTIAAAAHRAGDD